MLKSLNKLLCKTRYKLKTTYIYIIPPINQNVYHKTVIFELILGEKKCHKSAKSLTKSKSTLAQSYQRLRPIFSTQKIHTFSI